MRIFSSVSFVSFSSAISLSRSVICCAACSVIIDDMMHVKSIIMTMPLSMSSLTSDCPGAVSMFMPIISMAMAPAACADVRPNIMLPDDIGRRNSLLAI